MSVEKVEKTLKDKVPYLFVVLIITGLFAIIYRNANFRYPLVYLNGDEMGVYYYVKTIRDFGISLVNPMMGGINGTNMYDYVYSDGLSFLIVKIISIFVTNIYLITNLFYFIVHILIGITSLFVCRKLKYSNGISIIVSVLYALSPYIQMRYGHMWLTPYFMIPLGCMVAIKIVRGEILEDGTIWWKNKGFYKTVIISFLSAFTGLYYAFFTCALYAVAIVIRIINLKKEQIKKEIFSVLLIATVMVGCCISVIPNLLYWIKEGTNPSGELAIRSIGDAEFYGLKFIQLILPRTQHRLSILSELTEKYVNNYPLVNENTTVSLGIVASIGFLLSLILLFKDKKDKTLSYLNIGTFLVATIGGIGSLFSLLVHSPMRCYNRMSVIIMFFSLLVVADVLENVQLRCNRVFFYMLLIGIMMIGVWDQTVDYQPYDYSQIDCNREFINKIENTLPEGSLVFELPYVNWPSQGRYGMFIGYLESDELRWSYGAMQGRKEADWQQYVVQQDTDTMLKMLAVKGYRGIYLDKDIYVDLYRENQFEQVCNDISSCMDSMPMISENGRLYFWDIGKYVEKIEEQYTEKEQQEIINYIDATIQMYYGEEFYGLETNGEDTWNWMSHKAHIDIVNNGDEDIETDLNMLAVGGTNGGKLKLIYNGECTEYNINDELVDVDVLMKLKPGINTIQLDYVGDLLDVPKDSRELGVQLINVEVSCPIIK